MLPRRHTKCFLAVGNGATVLLGGVVLRFDVNQFEDIHFYRRRVAVVSKYGLAGVIDNAVPAFFQCFFGLFFVDKSIKTIGGVF